VVTPHISTLSFHTTLTCDTDTLCAAANSAYVLFPDSRYPVLIASLSSSAKDAGIHPNPLHALRSVIDLARGFFLPNFVLDVKWTKFGMLSFADSHFPGVVTDCMDSSHCLRIIFVVFSLASIHCRDLAHFSDLLSHDRGVSSPVTFLPMHFGYGHADRATPPRRPADSTRHPAPAMPSPFFLSFINHGLPSADGVRKRRCPCRHFLCAGLLDCGRA
jgi:hypothetical protein